MGLVSLQARTVKDLVTVRGIQENTIEGMGLVIGLTGTGDKKHPERDELIKVVIHNNGLNLTGQDFDSKNVAIVMVTGKLPPFGSVGQKIDLVVSAIGDAKSIKNGTLRYTQLRHPGDNSNKTVYATADGPIELPAGTPTTSGVIRGTIQNEVPHTLIRDGQLELLLRSPSATDASRIARQINQHFAKQATRDIARAVSHGQVNVELPETFKSGPVGFIAEIEQIPVLITDSQAKVRINSKTGMLTFNERVEVSPFAVSIRDLNINVGGGQNNAQPQEGEVIDFPRATPPDPANPDAPPPNRTSLQSLVDALNLMKVTPEELVEVIKEAHKIGALHAELIVE